MPRIVVLAFLVPLLLVACIPLPLPRQVSVRPQLDIVANTASGEPVMGAEIRVRRFISGPPPDTETHRWEAATGVDGRLLLSAIEARESYMPLMMHGVNWYSWDVCASHPTLGVATHTVHGTQPVMEPVAVPLVLDPAVTSCGRAGMPAP